MRTFFLQEQVNGWKLKSVQKYTISSDSRTINQAISDLYEQHYKITFVRYWYVRVVMAKK